MKKLPEHIYFDLEDLAEFSPTHATPDELEEDDGLVIEALEAMVEAGELDQDGYRPADGSYVWEDDDIRLDITEWKKVD